MDCIAFSIGYVFEVYLGVRRCLSGHNYGCLARLGNAVMRGSSYRVDDRSSVLNTCELTCIVVAHECGCPIKPE